MVADINNGRDKSQYVWLVFMRFRPADRTPKPMSSAPQTSEQLQPHLSARLHSSDGNAAWNDRLGEDP
jgi:hypothetical protein